MKATNNISLDSVLHQSLFCLAPNTPKTIELNFETQQKK